jgi:hypothetical protein
MFTTNAELSLHGSTPDGCDLNHTRMLSQEECFHFLRRLLNYEACRIEGRPQTTQFLDYQVANSDVEAEHDHFRVGDHYVRVLTIKEAINNGQASRSQATLGSSGEFLRGLPSGCRSTTLSLERKSQSASGTSMSPNHLSFHQFIATPQR